MSCFTETQFREIDTIREFQCDAQQDFYKKIGRNN